MGNGLEEENLIDYKVAIDIPDIQNIRAGNPGEYVCVDYFDSKESAIKWAMENLGADENGNINVISEI